MSNNTDPITLYERIAKLETKVDHIIDNHLHTIEKKINWIFVFIITTLAGVLVSLLT